MAELKGKLDFIYKKYLEEQWEEEAESNRELNRKLHELALSNPPPPSGKLSPGFLTMAGAMWS